MTNFLKKKSNNNLLIVITRLMQALVAVWLKCQKNLGIDTSQNDHLEQCQLCKKMFDTHDLHRLGTGYDMLIVCDPCGQEELKRRSEEWPELEEEYVDPTTIIQQVKDLLKASAHPTGWTIESVGPTPSSDKWSFDNGLNGEKHFALLNKTAAEMLTGVNKYLIDNDIPRSAAEAAEINAWKDQICEGCGWERKPDEWQVTETEVNLRDGSKRYIHFCDTTCCEFWDDTEPGDWVELASGEEVQLSLWRCNCCDGVYEHNLVKLLVDTDYYSPDDQVVDFDKITTLVCSFCQNEEINRFKTRTDIK